MPHALPHRLIDNDAVQANFEDIEDTLQEKDLIFSLPKSPTDGQIINYQPTGSIVWQFRYNAKSGNASKWEFVGGAPWPIEVFAFEETASAAYVDLATPGPSFTAPFPGVYWVSFGCRVVGTSGAAEIHQPVIQPFLNGAESGYAQVSAIPASGYQESGWVGYAAFSLNKGDILKLKYQTNRKAGFTERRMVIQPGRVG